MGNNKNLKSSDRLCCKYTTEIDIIRKDSLDYALQSIYNHCEDLFLDKSEIVIQPETIGCSKQQKGMITKIKESQSGKIYDNLIIGGLKEKISPFSVKLMNSGPHIHLTNPGYSRKPLDGNYFNY